MTAFVVFSTRCFLKDPVSTTLRGGVGNVWEYLLSGIRPGRTGRGLGDLSGSIRMNGIWKMEARSGEATGGKGRAGGCLGLEQSALVSVLLIPD